MAANIISILIPYKSTSRYLLLQPKYSRKYSKRIQLYQIQEYTTLTKSPIKRVITHATCTRRIIRPGTDRQTGAARSLAKGESTRADPPTVGRNWQFDRN